MVSQLCAIKLHALAESWMDRSATCTSQPPKQLHYFYYFFPTQANYKLTMRILVPLSTDNAVLSVDDYRKLMIPANGKNDQNGPFQHLLGVDN